MAFKDRFGITNILGAKYNNLDISWDFDNNIEDIKQRYPVLLFTPDIDDEEHYHLKLNKKEARKLQKWLNDYFEGKPTRYKK